jgi:hypothetical protein
MGKNKAKKGARGGNFDISGRREKKSFFRVELWACKYGFRTNI